MVPPAETFIPYDLSWAELAFRLGTATLLGAVLGWDRERRRVPAGLRTHMMVSLGAAGFAIMCYELLEVATRQDWHGIDPTRILQAIVGGVGFLGAGTIMHAGQRIHGVTTASGIWVVAAVGLAAGMGHIHLAVLLTGFGFFTLTVMRFLETHLVGDESDDDDSQRVTRANSTKDDRLTSEDLTGHSSVGQE
ncbi:MAG: MgtC/SapB family protein [Phycisphaerales bacterium]